MIFESRPNPPARSHHLILASSLVYPTYDNSPCPSQLASFNSPNKAVLHLLHMALQVGQAPVFVHTRRPGIHNPKPPLELAVPLGFSPLPRSISMKPFWLLIWEIKILIGKPKQMRVA